MPLNRLYEVRFSLCVFFTTFTVITLGTKTKKNVLGKSGLSKINTTDKIDNNFQNRPKILKPYLGALVLEADDPSLNHLVVEVVTLTGPLSDTGKHGVPTVRLF